MSGTLPLDEKRLVKVALIIVVEVGGTHRVAAHDHVAVIVLVELERELLLHRHGMKTTRFGEGALDQRQWQIMPGQNKEPDRRLSVIHVLRRHLQRPRSARELI